MSQASTGIFDSGAGGLTVAGAAVDRPPPASPLHPAGTVRRPYGPEPIAQVRPCAPEATGHLAGHGVGVPVTACNGAGAATGTLRHRFRATGDTGLFAQPGRRFPGPETQEVELAAVGGSAGNGHPG
ncbi:hypothetical protein [Planomonospora venezuelensis]|uniref:Glutamate racemase n=1 Tax=Planomonospora venezuelensis TaxID=1999 RepID=A0A841D5G6_PLAVE|nr:hypothetical protein [Planomonospora venezuelensis]MBB5965892.1 glutamate racemase [Planomonospora venezuelensis]GIN04085.1 hypothetical protein Pve01_57430 [Planomonospora venezuelensis]